MTNSHEVTTDAMTIIKQSTIQTQTIAKPSPIWPTKGISRSVAKCEESAISKFSPRMEKLPKRGRACWLLGGKSQSFKQEDLCLEKLKAFGADVSFGCGH